MKKLISAVLFATVLSLALPVLAAAPRPMEVKYGDGSYALRQSDVVNARVLAAATNENVPVWSYTDAAGITKYSSYVLFSATCNFYVKMGGAAAIPASDVVDGSAPELNPSMRFLGGNVTTFGLISPDACVVTISFYK